MRTIYQMFSEGKFDLEYEKIHCKEYIYIEKLGVKYLLSK